MSIICITGHPGTGKSTILNELLRLGYSAYGLDEQKISSYFNLSTREPSSPVPAGIDRNPEWRRTNVWHIDVEAVRTLRAANHPALTFILGNGYNIEEVWDLSDHIIVLQLDVPETHNRLTSRTTNSFGSHPGELDLAVQMGQTIHDKAKAYTKRPIHYIDASQTLGDIVSGIFAIIET